MGQLNNFNAMTCCPVKFQVTWILLYSHLSAYLSIYLSIYPSIHPSIYWSLLQYPELVSIWGNEYQDCISSKKYFEISGEKIKRIFHDVWKLHEIWISVSMNKVVLQQSPTHWIMFLPMVASAQQWRSKVVATETILFHKAWSIYWLALYRKFCWSLL